MLSNSGEEFSTNDHYQDLIGQANSIPIIKVLKHYRIKVDDYNRRTTCPFKSHKGGHESNPSFWYYPETNTFFCYGCRIGAQACNFVAEMDRCTRLQAAYKILEMFGSDVDQNNIYNPQDFQERLKIMMDFSNTVRLVFQTYQTPEARIYVEQACQKYDEMSLKYKLDNEELQRIVEKLKKYIGLFKI